MDSDSYIRSPIAYDPFRYMQKRKKLYAWRLKDFDELFVTEGMWNLLDDYTKAHSDVYLNTVANDYIIYDKKEDQVKERVPMYYNNFEIVHLPTFRRPEIQQWFQELRKDPERTYIKRWGKFYC